LPRGLLKESGDETVPPARARARPRGGLVVPAPGSGGVMCDVGTTGENILRLPDARVSLWRLRLQAPGGAPPWTLRCALRELALEKTRGHCGQWQAYESGPGGSFFLRMAAVGERLLVLGLATAGRIRRVKVSWSSAPGSAPGSGACACVCACVCACLCVCVRVRVRVCS
jgi:hypothetical protein